MKFSKYDRIKGHKNLAAVLSPWLHRQSGRLQKNTVNCPFSGSLFASVDLARSSSVENMMPKQRKPLSG
ncbi:unnamed protein product [Protopolystoma xenopodis]|uniref:Uncharacterized protein n=1 Tax=Protopolystoma xenopodis TaxID=117903 RepID=A0A3S5BZ26_9PLAT|nr:unnamed protein product [Protopolystoma xenopodis]